MKKISLSTISVILLSAAVLLSGCESGWLRKIDPRNDDSVTYHNKFVEQTNILLEKTKSISDAYSEVLTQVENGKEVLEFAAFSQTVADLKKTHAEAQNDLYNTTSKDTADEVLYLSPFKSVYVPSLGGLEKAYQDLIDYLAKNEGKYEIRELEKLTVAIDGSYESFINDHNVFIDQINAQVK